jgi:hypothetical protein
MERPLAIASGMLRSERAKAASIPRMKNRITGEARVANTASMARSR